MGGSRIAEMQLRVLWEEIMKRFRFVEVVGKPERVKSSFVKGYAKLPQSVIDRDTKLVVSKRDRRRSGFNAYTGIDTEILEHCKYLFLGDATMTRKKISIRNRVEVSPPVLHRYFGQPDCI